LYIIWSLVKKKDQDFSLLTDRIESQIIIHISKILCMYFFKFAHQQLVVPVTTEMVSNMRTALVVVYRVTKNWQKVSSLSGGHLIQF
jgi:hypothetical protein